ncbi:hypothetical protein N3K66_005108 [Trichothecium roseum]|uniref:Uncharacterized protein n=1 Tax=Trichothecium roseum TaxID=47278 RepID=A0ACC0V5V1_9HYPO|nr:hypothetical protein N3K66_005108 [Trichothecium roseum]
MVSLRTLGALLAAVLPLGLTAPVTGEVAALDISDRYIVTLKTDITKESLSSHLTWVDGVHKRSLRRRDLSGVDKQLNIGSFHGYSGAFDEATVEELRRSGDVVRIEPVQLYYPTALTSQENATHGLGTISSREPGSSIYTYDDSAGKGGYAYVLDSGIRLTHEEFGGRATFGYNPTGGDNVDTMGHGTHVAATIAGSTFGVAKGAEVIDIKVFGEGPSTSDIILDGFQWAVDDIIAKDRVGRAVLNLSLGGPASNVWDDIINAAYELGILSIAASGNTNIPAVQESPANSANALTVGGIGAEWDEGVYSNYGEAVDILAPGTSVTSAGIASDTATLTDTGTSMAAPHVAGLALYLSVLENITTAQALKARILELGTPNMVQKLKEGSPNLIAFNGIA